MFLSLCQIPFKCLMLRKCPNQGLYGNRKTEFQDFSRTFQEVFFSFFKTQFLPNFVYSNTKSIPNSGGQFIPRFRFNSTLVGQRRLLFFRDGPVFSSLEIFAMCLLSPCDF